MTAERTPRVEAAARLAHERLMWTRSVNGAGKFWDAGPTGSRSMTAMTEDQRDGWREYASDILAAADAVQREVLTERVAEVLDAHRMAPHDEHPDWTCRCGAVIAYAGLHLDIKALIQQHQAAAVVAAIYGGRPGE